MKRILILALFALLLLTACAVVPTGRGYGPEGVMVVPLLPRVVVLRGEPYYYYKGFHYHYVDDRWYYSRSGEGPWADLPRDHYPREVRYKGRDRHKHRDWDNGRDDRYDRRHDDGNRW